MSVIDTIKSLLGADPVQNADADMQEVLDALASLNPKPIEDLDALEARRQPTATDAVKKVMAQKGLSGEIPGVSSRDIVIRGAVGDNPARVYTPTSATPDSSALPGGAFPASTAPDSTPALPVILYFHGGGFVIADLDVYDATPRSIAAQTGAIVVSAHYRQAPEHPFPAAHDDANAAWRWLLDNAASLGGDPSRLAVLGESAGANLAANVTIYARDHGLQLPVSQGLVYPIADTNTHTLSYEENRNAKPLNKPMMLWFVLQSLVDSDDQEDKRLRLVEQDLSNLPPTFVVTAGIDPLRSDGEKLAEGLESAGNAVQARNYPGATHEFFGMAAVVQAAREAQSFVAEGMRAAFVSASGAATPHASSVAPAASDTTTASMAAPAAVAPVSSVAPVFPGASTTLPEPGADLDAPIVRSPDALS
ncbi:alpha/beta hydrolase [Robbsia sp. Bb-Pol-6]|uniref:Alpha/beta hydrolase n=1 Tax=Robbsia betulipollinis TaxID=2981849 RepID=A0ABT3ZKC7_9BURK|nr:alpha/beta hydrolase [Robbsia betulipollinis]MCY0386907.1 alpha/beta hydrolase [Robbsia betulipollinis]